MRGLRARQKADRNRRILDAALSLFREQGYAGVRIEDIAVAAEVSSGTCYNYFSTKGDILLAIVSMEVEEVVEAGHTVVGDPPADPADALDRLIRIYYDHSLHYLSKTMWRAAMALSIDAPDTPFSQRYRELDAMLCRQVSALIRTLIARGHTRSDQERGQSLDPEVLGRIVFNNLNQLFIEFVQDDAMSISTLHETSRRSTDLLASLLRDN